MTDEPEKTVLLVGAGHAHLYVAARAGLFRARGIRPVLIDPGEFWYSGLATGMLAGTYAPQEDRLDPGPLIERHGGEHVPDRVVAIHPEEQRVTLASGEGLHYDLLSLNVGSEVRPENLPGDDGGRLWPVKPIANVWSLRRNLETSMFRNPALHRLVVVGGGATGCEIAACALALAARYQAGLDVTLVTDEPRLIPEAPAGAARWLEAALIRRGVRVITGTRIVSLEDGVPVAASGERYDCDTVVQATGLRAAALVGEAGLPCDPENGLLVEPTLRSVADPRVFAAGDCAHLAGHDLPRLGVFSVRQAPVLAGNLLAAAGGEGDLQSYRPQKRWLSILNLGDGEALAIRGRFYWHGWLAMQLKHLLDTRFVEGYRSLAEGDGPA